jgi:hypothetical protein
MPQLLPRRLVRLSAMVVARASVVAFAFQLPAAAACGLILRKSFLFEALAVLTGHCRRGRRLDSCSSTDGFALGDRGAVAWTRSRVFRRRRAAPGHATGLKFIGCIWGGLTSASTGTLLRPLSSRT